MSIFGALSTADSGLTAQSHAFTDISNNISNSQTVGYKATETDFSDYVLSSGAAQGTNGTVRATTANENDAQGTITSSTNALALAISGKGFFSVGEESGDSTTTTPAFKTTAYYTRNGNFTENKQGYLVNSSNEFLKGYSVNASNGVLNTTLAPINVANVVFRPTPTTIVTDAATLPTDSAMSGGSALSTATSQPQTTVYDSAGAPHTLDETWTQTGAPNTWTLTAEVDKSSATPGNTMTATVSFDPTTGYLASITPAGGTANTTSGTPASFSVPAVSTNNMGAFNISLGAIGSAAGTSVAGNGSPVSSTSDSVTTGVYQGISMTSDGNILANFDNNETQLVGKVPLATFANSNGLASQDGEAFVATSTSGAATVTLSGENGAGDLETSSVENSTTSLDTDLTKLIVAQQAYGANAKVVTAANEMLQTVLSMKQ